MRERVTVLVVLIVIAAATLPVAASATSDTTTKTCDGGETETVHYTHPGFDAEVVYNFTFNESRELLCVAVENVGEATVNGGYRVVVDSRGLENPRPELAPGETLSVTHNVTPWLSLYDDNHTIGVGARGNNARFTFTRKIDALDPSVPSPEISSVDVVRYEQNDSTALRVSTYNPTKRGYGFYVQAETFGTDGVYRISAPQPNQSDRALLPLEESPDEVVAGKVRIFHQWGVTNGMYDQKEFMSKPNDSVASWDVPFNRVPGEVDTYNYHNESAAKYREGYVDDEALSPRQRRVGAAAVVALVAGTLWVRRRRKR